MQLHVVELRGRHGLIDGVLHHDVAGPTLLQQSGLLDGSKSQKGGCEFLGLATEIRQTDACRCKSRGVDRVIRTVGRHAEVARLRPGRAHGSPEPPPVVAGALGGKAMGLLVFPVGLATSAVVVVGLGTVEADQSVRVLVVVFFVGRGPDRRKDKPVVVVGYSKEVLESLDGIERAEVAQCIAVSCVERL